MDSPDQRLDRPSHIEQLEILAEDKEHMAVRTLKVAVTEKHIKSAQPSRWRTNPVALALRDAGFRYVDTGASIALLSKSSRGLVGNDHTVLSLPLKVSKFLTRYWSNPNKRTKLRPVSFVVKLTPDVEKHLSAVRHIEGIARLFDEETETVLTPAA